MSSVHLNINRLIFSDSCLIAVSILSGLILAISLNHDLLIAAVLLPVLLISVVLLLINPRVILYITFFTIPLSSAVPLGAGVTIDFPGELLLLILSLITLCFIVIKGFPKRFLNVISILIGLHIFWIFISALFANSPVIAIKFLLAKVWYVLPFYVLPFYIISEQNHLRNILKWFIAGLSVASLYFFVSHFAQDLTYAARTNAGIPIWRNHVNYACTLVLSLPILYYLRKSSKHPDRWIYFLVMVVFCVFIYFAYARIAYICLLTAVLYFVILKLDFTHIAIVLSLLVLSLGLIYLISDNQYLHLAPNYERTIMQADFEKKISSTITGEDISSMERIHRWVAGFKIIEEHPYTGIGPGNFYNNYRPYTIYSFETYVSDNADKSGIHNYYLMTLTEQGYIGLLILSFLAISILVKVQKIFSSLNKSDGKDIILLAGTTIAMVLVINTVNDMMEVIKIGSLFFFFTFIVSYFSFELDTLDR